MQRTKSLMKVCGVRFPRHGNAGTQSPGRPTAATKKANQIDRFVFNSAKHKNITGLSERHSLDHTTPFASWHLTCTGYDKLFTKECLHCIYTKRAPLTTSHGRLRWLVCSLLWTPCRCFNDSRQLCTHTCVLWLGISFVVFSKQTAMSMKIHMQMKPHHTTK